MVKPLGVHVISGPRLRRTVARRSKRTVKISPSCPRGQSPSGQAPAAWNSPSAQPRPSWSWAGCALRLPLPSQFAIASPPCSASYRSAHRSSASTIAGLSTTCTKSGIRGCLALPAVQSPHGRRCAAPVSPNQSDNVGSVWRAHLDRPTPPKSPTVSTAPKRPTQNANLYHQQPQAEPLLPCGVGCRQSRRVCGLGRNRHRLACRRRLRVHRLAAVAVASCAVRVAAMFIAAAVAVTARCRFNSSSALCVAWALCAWAVALHCEGLRRCLCRLCPRRRLDCACCWIAIAPPLRGLPAVACTHRLRLRRRRRQSRQRSADRAGVLRRRSV